MVYSNASYLFPEFRNGNIQNFSLVLTVPFSFLKRRAVVAVVDQVEAEAVS